MSRPTNEELCKAFRRLLLNPFLGEKTDGRAAEVAQLLENTKPWRNDLWKAFKEVEARLCPSKDGGPR